MEFIADFYDSEVDRWELLGNNLDILSEAIDNEKELIPLLRQSKWAVYSRLVNYRKGSLSAKIDKESIDKRPCFLCHENRPADQRVMTWENYEILANPYPLADYHFTIASVEHIPQRILCHIKDMTRLARLLEGDCVFYNGPLCGASAPDHLHFQAFDEYMALNFWRPLKELVEIIKIGKSRVYTPKENERLFPYLIIESVADKELDEIFNRIYHSLPPADPEPMMNIIMQKDGGKMRTMIVPRRRHRPTFYGTGEGEMLISPASVEMLGTFITSRKEDFDRLDAKTVRKIYREVCLTPKTFDNVINAIKTYQPT